MLITDVRFELRRIETISAVKPTSRITETVVVQEPKHKWNPIHIRDVAFELRIPENTPPSCTLDDDASIEYELVAEASLLTNYASHRSEPQVRLIQTTAKIMLDKHDLHSTWPVYLNSDFRSTQKNGFELLATWNHACVGPGDQILVKAIFKSKMGSSNARVYSIALRRINEYRLGSDTRAFDPHNNPLIRHSLITTHEYPVAVPLGPGGAETQDLGCTLPTMYRTPTVATASHIKFLYYLEVRITLDDQSEVVINDIPIMISGWPRNISETMIKYAEIGP
ncbi:hypothetical protein DL93DRAFT_1334369 [Clavulina sp. PMI_390]|nr:hypothetical protein DL93DRAFT_1334369 [Clavulina sp. PMI_390]